MTISKSDTEKIFYDEVRTRELTGTATPEALRQGFRRMKERMEAGGATDQELDGFRRKIEKAIDTYPWRAHQQDERETARDALLSVFDGIVRDDRVQGYQLFVLGGSDFLNGRRHDTTYALPPQQGLIEQGDERPYQTY